ncbi:bifunctional diguanylate cyclase/phosphodiesterase [Chromatocurvus halotolerans]|uniref:Diguanylate cyclase (GGDEF)-like protein n=1 Tax=Chromatocurvus halotolerans TaxID=1132028 RepID=A0A4R2KYT1_9GAMM|nr:EAL domain-containing protein [Chromatocurvus halotolerans]TCO71855.1 diguanylate cyclase (GGDEF)-like protein [Chromatocurvus halotolerans]
MTDYLKKIEQEINSAIAYGDQEVTLDNCDREPIHLIGHIQSHGVLVVSELTTNGIQTIDFLSENTSQHLGIEPGILLGQPLDALISEHSLEMLRQALTSPVHNSQTYYDLEIHSPRVKSVQASCHENGGLLFIEFQPFLPPDFTSAAFDVDGKDVVAEFTTRMLRAQSFDDLATVMVLFFFEKLNYDRVMVYKFDDDDHGEVVAEAKQDHLEPFLGLNYPASDIPQFARYLYVQNRCRIITSILSEPVPINTMLQDSSNYQLDLRFSNLRSMSPIHIEYLSNMGIEASLTMSIVKDNKLFGMLIMHHYEPRYCELRSREVINQLSFICSDYVKLLDRVEAALGTERSQDIRNLINVHLFDNEQKVNYDDVAASILHVLDGDGIYVAMNGEPLFASGLLHEKIDLITQGLDSSRLSNSQVFYSSNLAKDWPEMFAGDSRICGLMLINLPSDRPSFIAVFRYERAKLVRWAGRKQEYSEADDGRLHARRSFKEWREYTKNQSLPWSNFDILNAKNLRSVFIRYLLRMNERYLAKLVSLDTLTELPNRHFITSRIDLLLDQNVAVGLLLIDCDRFKTINDSLGHDVGDKVLQEVARRLKSLEIPGSVVARLGGDEFTMLIQDGDFDTIEKMAANIVGAFQLPISFEHYNFYVPTSIGVAISAVDSTRSSLMRAADMAMYDAKHNGGNGYKFVNRGLMNKADERLAIEQNIYQALKQNEIVNYYQPITDSRTYSVCGFEVLCRWLKADGEIIPPLKFLGVAEQTGMIIPIGVRVIEQALGDLQRFQQKDRDLFMTLNFSPLQLLDDTTVDYLINEVREKGLDASKIWVEMTEESYIEDEKALIQTLDRLKVHDFKLALDDFGSGYSSMKYLTALPIDIVKFDKTLIDNIHNNAQSFKLLKASRQLASVCNLMTVAEGIETSEQKNCVSEINIDYQQGYLFGKPTDFAAAIKLIG